MRYVPRIFFSSKTFHSERNLSIYNKYITNLLTGAYSEHFKINFNFLRMRIFYPLHCNILKVCHWNSVVTFSCMLSYFSNKCITKNAKDVRNDQNWNQCQFTCQSKSICTAVYGVRNANLYKCIPERKNE